MDLELRQLECRKVVDHAVLFHMKEELTEEQEKEMLDALFTLQYQTKGVLYLSAGMSFLTSLLAVFAK